MNGTGDWDRDGDRNQDRHWYWYCNENKPLPQHQLKLKRRAAAKPCTKDPKHTHAAHTRTPFQCIYTFSCSSHVCITLCVRVRVYLSVSLYALFNKSFSATITRLALLRCARK